MREVGQFRRANPTPEQQEFTHCMLDIFRRQNMLNTVAFSLNLQELSEELPWTSDDPVIWANKLTLTFLLLEMGNWVADAEPTVPVPRSPEGRRSPLSESGL